MEDKLEFKKEEIELEKEKSFIDKNKKYSLLAFLIAFYKKLGIVGKSALVLLPSAVVVSSLTYFFAFSPKKEIIEEVSKEEIKIEEVILKETPKVNVTNQITIHLIDGSIVEGELIKKSSESYFVKVSNITKEVDKEEVYKTTIK
jgi:hypothetical protein